VWRSGCPQAHFSPGAGLFFLFPRFLTKYFFAHFRGYLQQLQTAAAFF
jgi:hypothetical protein